MTEQQNGAEFILGAVCAEGVGHVFMVPGGHNDPFMIPMVRTPGLQTVVAAFEGGAAFMADGYARASGRFGVAFGIGGPGVLNMATALMSSYSDFIPVLAISGEVPVSWEGRGAFQDAGTTGIDDTVALRSLVSESVRVESTTMLSNTLRGLLLHAVTRREPVHLSVPLDIQTGPQKLAWQPLDASLYQHNALDQNAFDEALGKLTAKAGTVAIFVGAGMRSDEDGRRLIEVAERYEIPVATSQGAKGFMPEDHPLSLGVFGYGGSRWATGLLTGEGLDSLIVIGSALSQRDTLQWDPALGRNRTLIHVDEKVEYIGRTYPASLPVVGSGGAFLQALLDASGKPVSTLNDGIQARRDLLAKVQATGRREYGVEARRDDSRPMNPARVIAAAREVLPRQTVAVVDSGAHRAFAAQNWQSYGPRNYLSATNMGPMGAAIPLTVGAEKVRPDVRHLTITSDGCMLMHGLELHTAVREGSNMIVLISNNQSYGNIWYRAHTMGPKEAALTDIPGVDWVGFARSVGAQGESVENPDELHAAFERASEATGPYVVDARTDKAAAKPTTEWDHAVAIWEDND